MRINTHLQLLTNKKKPKHKNYKWRSKLTLSFWPNSYLPSFSGDVDEHDDSEGDEYSKLTTAFSSLQAASPAGSTRMAVSAPCRPAMPYVYYHYSAPAPAPRYGPAYAPPLHHPPPSARRRAAGRYAPPRPDRSASR